MNAITQLICITLGMALGHSTDTMKEEVKNMLKFYQENEMINFPGSNIPDSMVFSRAIHKDLRFSDLDLTGVTVIGCSKFIVKHVDVNLRKMQVNLLIHFQKLDVVGTYELKTLFMSIGSGPFSVTLMEVDIHLTIALAPDNEGWVYANITDLYTKFQRYTSTFDNMSGIMSFFKDDSGDMAAVLMADARPLMVEEANRVLYDYQHTNEAFMDRKLRPSDIAPERLMAMCQEHVRREGYDPFRTANRNFTIGSINLTFINMTASGWSDIRPAGEIGLWLEGPRAKLGITAHLIAGPMIVTFQWRCNDTGFSGFLGSFGGTTGVAAFVTQVEAQINIDWPLNRRPSVNHLDIEVGPFKAATDRRDPLVAKTEEIDVLNDMVKETIRQLLEVELNRIQLDDVVDKIFQALPKSV